MTTRYALSYDDARSRRVEIFAETRTAFDRAPGFYEAIAMQNLAAWHRRRADRTEHPATPIQAEVRVIRGDWGDVTGQLTREFGEIFAVLNMASSRYRGGGVYEGSHAQEENMFRRTNCYQGAETECQWPGSNEYIKKMTELVSGQNGQVLLSIEHPRVCVRGREDSTRPDLGYWWLRNQDIFPFYELRSAAVNVKRVGYIDEAEMRKRIGAQFSTLLACGVRHVVFGAFGCGAFRNPARAVAEIYRDEIIKHRDQFDVIAFAILSTGEQPDNYTVFSGVLNRLEVSGISELAANAGSGVGQGH